MLNIIICDNIITTENSNFMGDKDGVYFFFSILLSNDFNNIYTIYNFYGNICYNNLDNNYKKDS